MRLSTLTGLEVDDGRSVMSQSTIGSHSSETIKHSTHTLQTQLKNRKFTAALGKVGYAREARDAVAKLINRRAPPLAEPIDFEGFVTEFNAELETDTLRDLIVFPRDDIALCKPCERELSAVEKVANFYSAPTEWGLARDALQHYSNPCSVVKFNYEGFYGDCEKYLANSGLEPLVFESEDPMDSLKEKEALMPVGTLREGQLLVELKGGDSLVRAFKGRKRRFCVIRRAADGHLTLDVAKQPDAAKTSFVVKSAHLRTWNKQRTNVLEIVPHSAKDAPDQVLVFPSDLEPDVASWFQAIDLALKCTNAETDSLGKDSEPSLAETINESLKSSASSGDQASRASSLRAAHSVEALLRPPHVKRKNLFSLCEGVEPLPKPGGEPSALLEDADDLFKPCNVEGGRAAAGAEPPRARPDDAQHCHAVAASGVRVELSCDRLAVLVRTEDGLEQIEPFFVYVFFFDLRTGERVSNEIPLVIVTDEFAEKLKEINENEPFKVCIFGKDQVNWKAFIQLPEVSDQIFVVARFERIMSGLPSDIYLKSVVERKQMAKHAKLMSNAMNRLYNYRTLFGWSARPVTADADPAESWPVFKAEGHLTDLDLRKLLADFQKLQKAGKLTAIPHAHFHLKQRQRPESVDLPLKTLTPPAALEEAGGALAFQRLEAARSTTARVRRACANQLLVYPLHLSFGAQKSFARARNICCTVRLVRQAGGAPAAPAPLLLDLGSVRGPLVRHRHCALHYHEPSPHFHDEVRLQLPTDLNEADHLLFQFHHVSLANAQKPTNEPVEQSIGTAWLQLVRPDKTLTLTEDCQEFELPVAANLPNDYYLCDPTASVGKKAAEASSIKWVEGGKALFRLRLRLDSALFSSCAPLQRFFQRATTATTASPATAATAGADLLAAQVPFARLQPHLHVLLNALLQLFTRTADPPTEPLAPLLHLLEHCHRSERRADLREFLRFHLAVGGEFEVDARALYEGLLQAIGLTLSAEPESGGAPIATLRHLWFLLDVCVKSMAQTMLANGAHKYGRRRRFSALTVEAMETTFSAALHHILAQHQRHPAETRAANVALAFFAKHCLNVADRGAVHAILHDMVKRLDVNDVGLPRHYKLDLLQILVSHEHWLPLNLPMLFDGNNKPLLGLAGTKIEEHAQDALRVAKSALRSTNILSRLFSQFLPSPLTPQTPVKNKTALNAEHFQLSRTFCSTHFLVGILLQEFSAALHESRVYRKQVIAIIRNLLVKHSVDLRYDGAAAQSRIAVLYAPLIQVLMDHVDEFEVFKRPEVKDPASDEAKENKFDYAQSTARSILSKDLSGTINNNTSTTTRATDHATNGQRIAQLAEKLDQSEARDLVLCALYVLNNLPKQVVVALAFAPRAAEPPPPPARRRADDYMAMVNLLRLSLLHVRCQDPLRPAGASLAGLSLKKPLLPAKDQKLLSLKQIRKLFVQESHLAQEAALVALDVSHTLAEYVAGRWSGAQLDPTQERQLFHGLLQLKLELVGEQWPEGVRLNALNSLGMFIELFAAQLAAADANDALSGLCQRLLLLLNSRLEKVQASAAAILHLLIRQGFNATFEAYARQVDQKSQEVSLPNQGRASSEWLGNPGLQITIALAYLLGQNALSADCPRFEHGLHLFETLTANQLDRKLELFKRSAQDLANQLRDILKATISISEARNDPIRLAELHVQLADSYRGSPALRAAWFDTLAQIHAADRWYSEAAVCQAHCVAIIGKQLKARENIDIDFSLLESLNSQILKEENVGQPDLPLSYGGNFTVDALTAKVEETVKVLTLAERYEAVGPIYRLAIPLYERLFDNQALTSAYADLHQAYSRAAEIQASGRRHLGAYFRVVLHSPVYFRQQHRAEWVYREPALTSLAEACERMVQLFRRALGTENVRFLTELELDSAQLDPAIAHIQLTHVEPLLADLRGEGADVDFEQHLSRSQAAHVNYTAHSNVDQFFYEKPLVEAADEGNEKVPEQARLSLKRVFLKTAGTFPNTRRRLPVAHKSAQVLNPLQLACENLKRKAAQIKRVLQSAGIAESGPVDRAKLNALDLKGLQCLLQGSVSPTVNVGVLAYAEAFTSESQRAKYGLDGIDKLKSAFKIFMAQLARALTVNEMAVGQDQTEYQVMLKNSFDGMLERLCTFFDGENFQPEAQTPLTPKPPPAEPHFQSSAYILDSISGLPDRV